ncbi:MAG TPA: hypothetical protein VHM65_11120, partial [Candidatus Lustribacter sp.]|nr:hypothetical protein [Candidatus Lustribacter sp.]
MQPSSLIFVVIIAIWAFYLLQHWVRRREYLATAHSVDRFSDAIRVLEMHRETPSAVGPQGAPDDRPRSPLVARSSAASAAAPAWAASPTSPAPARSRLSHRGPVRRVSRPPVRAVVGVLLLAALVGLPATVSLAVVGRLTWLGVVLDLAALLGLGLVLRRAGVRRRAARRGLARRHTGGSSSVLDQASTSPGERSATGPAAEADVVVADPHAWTPVPVPPPTYTLKAKAVYREPAPTPALVAAPAPAPTAAAAPGAGAATNAGVGA